ncbi:MAG: glycosyl hydrolase [Bacteroidota bacterium]
MISRQIGKIEKTAVNKILDFKRYSIVILLAGTLVTCEDKQSPVDNTLEVEFKDPSIEYRPMALWPWLNGFVDTTQLVYELEQMKEKGMRGALIWDIGALIDPKKEIPEGPAFLEEQSLGYISLALKTADRLGLDLGMVAASSWNSGGPWIDSTEASMQLLHTSQIVEGPSDKGIEIIEPPADERSGANRHILITTLAIPYSPTKKIDTTSAFVLDELKSKDGRITWEVPEGQWEILSFFMSNTGQELVVPSPNSTGLIIDHLSKKATEVHMDSLLARLEPISSPESHLKFLMLDSYEVWPMQDWSPELVNTFQENYGYDLIPLLPILKDFTSGDTIFDERFRMDYKRVVSDMMIENHYAYAMEIANQHDIQLISEAGHGGYARVEPLKALGHSDMPMGEFWNRRRHWVTKEAASAAHIYGKKVVGSESLTGWNHWQHGPTDFKQLVDLAFCEGLNQVVFHTFTHNPEIAGKPGYVYHAGEHINVNTTWWPMARPFMDYIARSSYLLRQGNFVADACLYYGDQAPNLVPATTIDPNITPIFSDDKCLHCGRPKPIEPGKMTGYDYDYMNADVIINQMQVKDSRLILPSGQSYRVLQIPDRPDISVEVLRKLKQLVNEGAVILGRKPERATSLRNYPDCDSEVKAIADEMWGEVDGNKVFVNEYGKGKVFSGIPLREVMEEIGVEEDFKLLESNEHIRYIHRRTENEEIYFVINSNTRPQKISSTFRVDNQLIPEIWDAATGETQKHVDFTKDEKGITLDLVLDPFASRFVIFKSPSGEQNYERPGNLQFGYAMLNTLSSIDLSDSWQVSFDPDMGGPNSSEFDSLTSWSDSEDEDIKYYSGLATYSKTFTVQEDQLAYGWDIIIGFEDIQEMARVFVNGKDCGVVWNPPYCLNISDQVKSGENMIEVQVINTWNNRIVGDLVQNEHYTKTNAANKFTKDSELLPSGLIGEVKIKFVESN